MVQKLSGTKVVWNKVDLENIIDKSLMEQIDQPENFKFIIELQRFMNMCYEMNSVLSKFDHFLRVFELKNKFLHLTIKDKTQQKIVTQLSSCLIEKYNGFTIASIEYKKKKNNEKYFIQLILSINRQKILK